MSTHAPLHSVVPPPQLRAQEPCEQTSPGWQALPHAPQLSGSALVSTQLPLQDVWPVEQDGASLVASAVASTPASLLLLMLAVELLPPQPVAAARRPAVIMTPSARNQGDWLLGAVCFLKLVLLWRSDLPMIKPS